jgi:hypothetical protein
MFLHDAAKALNPDPCTAADDCDHTPLQKRTEFGCGR